jgi:hypothetical protein
VLFAGGAPAGVVAIVGFSGVLVVGMNECRDWEEQLIRNGWRRVEEALSHVMAAWSSLAVSMSDVARCPWETFLAPGNREATEAAPPHVPHRTPHPHHLQDRRS